MVNNFRNVYFIASWGLKLDLKNQNKFCMVFILYLFKVHSLARPSAKLTGKQQNCEYWCTFCFIYNRKLTWRWRKKENEIELLYSAGTLSSSLLGECPGLATETDTQLLLCRAPTIFTLFWTSPLKWWILSPSPGLMRQRMKWVSEGNDCRQAQLYYFNLLLLSAKSIVIKTITVEV